MLPSSTISFDETIIKKLVSTIPQIAYSELKFATDNWNKNNILGNCGFGTVFKGRWKHTDVAIKRFEYLDTPDDSKRNAKIEMRYLNSCRHDNILPLYGFSIDGKEHCLMFQYMAGGTLEYRLQNFQKPLTFKQRKQILIGTARGLQYLHTFSGTPLVHGDIKSANILLDEHDDCIAKIGDFGMVHELPFECTKMRTASPYLPNEFSSRYTNTKIDTFSYGVVLFELLTGLQAYDKNRDVENVYLAKYMLSICKSSEPIKNFIDRSLDMNETSITLFEQLFKIALICTTENTQLRPEMVDVLNRLENYIEMENVYNNNKAQ